MNNNLHTPSSVTSGDSFSLKREKPLVYFVGAGCGAADLITVRGMNLLKAADVIVYTGSLVNPELLNYAKRHCEIHNSATMTLEEVMIVVIAAARQGKMVVRLHTGEPSIYGAVLEQMQILEANGVPYESCPGVSACFGAAASLNLEYTLPDISQTLIITRMAGRTGVPEKESIEKLAAHNASMAIYLSSGMMEKLSRALYNGGYSKDTPAAIVYKASWPDEEKYICTVGTLAETAEAHGIKNLAVVLVGDVISKSGYSLSKLYDAEFETGFRKSR
jgi:precorrin-4/cobalt-precorrin-4 C11-methyltransferase